VPFLTPMLLPKQTQGAACCPYCTSAPLHETKRRCVTKRDSLTQQHCVTQDEAVHEYGPLQRLVEQAGPLCIGHFANLEQKTPGGLTAKRLRFLRQTMTKDARSTVITALADAKCTIAGLIAAAESANCEMWVDFHWTAENTFLHQDLRMPLPFTRSPYPFCMCAPVTSPVHRHLFSQQAAHGDLKVNLGRWQYTENNPRPAFAALAPGTGCVLSLPIVPFPQHTPSCNHRKMIFNHTP